MRFRNLPVSAGASRGGCYVDDIRERRVRQALNEVLADEEDELQPNQSLGPLFLPELLVGDHCTPAYAAQKAEQLRIACELWHTRSRIRSLRRGLVEAERLRAQVQQAQAQEPSRYAV